MEHQAEEYEGIETRRVELGNMRAKHAEELLNLTNYLEKLRQKKISREQKHEAKLASFETRINNAREEIRTLKESVARAESSVKELEMRKEEGAKDEPNEKLSPEWKANVELIMKLRLENTRLKKERAKQTKKLEKLTTTNKTLKERCAGYGVSFELRDSLSDTIEYKVKQLRKLLNDTKEIHGELKEKVMQQQDRYMSEAQARLELQKGMGRILNIIYDRCKKKKILEAVQSIGLQAESVYIAEIAIAEGKDDPSLTVTDVSDESDF